MKSARALAFAGLVLATAAGGWLVRAEQGSVTGTAHDLGAPGTGVSRCETCHVPHDEQGQIIWDGEPRPKSNLSSQALACYSCHDGTVASGSFVFADGVVDHPLDREAGEDCDTCHDPHVSDYGNFLMFPSGANFCQACHENAGDDDHPVNVKIGDTAYAPVDTHWDPESGDFYGTRLWDSAGRPGTEYTKCLTCHAVHAASPQNLLASDNEYGSIDGSGLCQNCHRGR